MVFARTQQRVAKRLRVSKYFLGRLYTEGVQIYDGKLNFATDAWTSPNHKAFVAITVHLEEDSKPLCLILDIVEVAEVWAYRN